MQSPSQVSAGGIPAMQQPVEAVQFSNLVREQLLAQGGMSDVYLAKDVTTGQVMAWKEAHNRFNPLRVSNSKLRGEAELLQSLQHPQLPKFITLGETINSDGATCGVLVEEFIEGGDLKETIAHVSKMGMSLPLDRIVSIFSDICKPLEMMASLPEPVYHRDLKPHNVIVHAERGPVLIDFGLAKMVASEVDVSITRGGSGTWTSPERDSGVSGPFTDVYSLGKMLYYLCVNEKPPAILGSSDALKVVSKGHPSWLADLIIKAADPRYQSRIQSVSQFRQVLESQGQAAEKVTTETSSDDYTTWS